MLLGMQHEQSRVNYRSTPELASIYALDHALDHPF
jgi:hypothetical protein